MTAADLAFPAVPGRPNVARSAAPAWGAVRKRALRAPLVVKLLGANLLIAIVAAGVAAIWGHPALIWYISVALLVSFAVNTYLVRLALSPLDELQRVAEHVSHGEQYVRVGASPVADNRIERLGTTFNRLLDAVSADRVHIHQLIRRGLGAREAERAALSRQLREATAQQLAALALQLSAVENAYGSTGGLSALRTSRVLTARMLDDVGRLADSIYPGLLQELGLPASLTALAARVRARSSLRITVESPSVAEHLSPALVTAMYHVAEEAVRNAERHAGARTVRVRLSTEDGALRLEVIDDGNGFDAAAVERSGRGVGLFQARELLANAHGRLEVESSSSGTRVIATARLDQGETS